jgi:hypothetical protein
VLKVNQNLLLILCIPIVLLALGIFYFYIDPTSFAYTPRCPFHALTGFHCPGCGSQRALHLILHGHIWEGIQHNFLIVIAVLLIGYKIYIFFTPTNSNEKSKNLLKHNFTPWIILSLIMTFWILRNLPLDIFQILAP